jgi:hypothetical protein
MGCLLLLLNRGSLRRLATWPLVQGIDKKNRATLQDCVSLGSSAIWSRPAAFRPGLPAGMAFHGYFDLTFITDKGVFKSGFTFLAFWPLHWRQRACCGITQN